MDPAFSVDINDKEISFPKMVDQKNCMKNCLMEVLTRTSSDLENKRIS